MREYIYFETVSTMTGIHSPFKVSDFIREASFGLNQYIVMYNYSNYYKKDEVCIAVVKISNPYKSNMTILKNNFRILDPVEDTYENYKDQWNKIWEIKKNHQLYTNSDYDILEIHNNGSLQFYIPRL